MRYVLFSVLTGFSFKDNSYSNGVEPVDVCLLLTRVIGQSET
jgi:hypothetical protein